MNKKLLNTKATKVLKEKTGQFKIPAVMELDAGEEIAVMWATPTIPGSGFYKLLAKKKIDGTYEWAHFIQREDGRKERVMRGTVDNKEQLDLVVEIADRNLMKIFGPAFGLRPTDADMLTMDGKKSSPYVQ
jgi:hypothetical protein